MVVVCATAAQVFEYRGAICLFRAVMGQVSLYFTVEASSLCHQFLLMFSEGSFLGLHSIYLHGDQVVFSSLPFEGVFPQLFLVFAHFGGLHKSQVLFYLVSLVFILGHFLPLADCLWPALSVHAGLCQAEGESFFKERD